MSASYDFSALWIIVNQLDLSDLLVLLLVNISFFTPTDQTAFRKMKDYITIINPVAVIQFFSYYLYCYYKSLTKL